MTAEAVMGTVARLLRERERSNVTMAQRVAGAGDALVLRSAPMSDRDVDDIAVAWQANVRFASACFAPALGSRNFVSFVLLFRG